MVHFSKLKLYGFKSFVDKTELDIGPGLNGIVGPNGCGKSNLVEALRWVMGEKSAKNMRGGGMEDVIFAGTSKRPARSLAEVTVVMNNEDGTAPAPFNAATEIEINRKIEKDKGSQYRVNGKAVRARDVNLLFADTMTGANSPALVSQGRITEIITAKPSDRRKILEESAGISGLHSRRHEAELRLRAAENNLTRLDDSLNDMRSRLSSLKRQARQAERYKELNDDIRRLDMALAWSEWRETHSKIKAERAEFDGYNTQVQSALEISKDVAAKIETLEIDLPDIRKNHMEAQAILQNFRVSLERLEQDIQSKAKGLQDALDAKEQINQDSAFTQSQYDEIIQNIETAKKDLADLESNGETLPAEIEKTKATLDAVNTTLNNDRNAKQAIETKIAIAEDSRQNLQNQHTQIQGEIAKLDNNINLLNNAITETETKITDIKTNPVFDVDMDALSSEIETLKGDIATLNTQSSTAQETLKSHQDDKDTLSATLRGYEGELSGLQNLLAQADTQTDMPSGDDALLNALNVTDGYEKAVSVALGQWIAMAGLHDGAAVYWAQSDVKIDTPVGTKSLDNYVDAPQTLAPLLNAIGVVDTLPTSSPKLKAGQMMIARDGGFIRWDGLRVQASAIQGQDTTHIILEQKNRVSALENLITETQSKIEKSTQALDKAEGEAQTLQDKIETTREKLSAQEKSYTEKTYTIERLNDQLSALNEKLNDQNNRLTQNKTELETAQSNLDSLTKHINESDDTALEAYRTEIATLDDTITNHLATIAETQSTLNNLQQAQTSRTQNMQRLVGDITRYESEQEKLSIRLDDFTQRADTIDAKILAYKTAEDNDTDAVREELLTKIAAQDTTLTAIATDLDAKDTLYKTLQTELRNAESQAAAARENRARIQANVANAEENLKHIQTDMQDRFEISPQGLEEKVFSFFDSDIPSIETLHTNRETVMRNRDNIGPVNLRAALESQETEQHLSEMEAEYTDLTTAIDQLRGGIAKLNREAKERLAIAFTRVDGHFQKLFAQLFEGGKAYLEMIESDDPLESGLEIYAQPPGKSLQKLSLLSGGEQTLTATALIFGMFLTNPSPICVLDEIDAPLDDANVDRVCSLMEHIAADTDTRFIVITHHRMTMARMDRLYGVTMGERGVSQLVSVDMALQAEMELSETG